MWVSFIVWQVSKGLNTYIGQEGKMFNLQFGFDFVLFFLFVVFLFTE